MTPGLSSKEMIEALRTVEREIALVGLVRKSDALFAVVESVKKHILDRLSPRQIDTAIDILTTFRDMDSKK